MLDDGLTDGDGDTEGDALLEGLALLLGETLGEVEDDGDWLLLGLIEGDSLDEGL